MFWPFFEISSFKKFHSNFSKILISSSRSLSEFFEDFSTFQNFQIFNTPDDFFHFSPFFFENLDPKKAKIVTLTFFKSGRRNVIPRSIIVRQLFKVFIFKPNFWATFQKSYFFNDFLTVFRHCEIFRAILVQIKFFKNLDRRSLICHDFRISSSRSIF